jgi:basic membrane lipoprotein Med (substrate-binding protein (PBP1-ABC) superfamily)
MSRRTVAAGSIAACISLCVLSGCGGKAAPDPYQVSVDAYNKLAYGLPAFDPPLRCAVNTARGVPHTTLITIVGSGHDRRWIQVAYRGSRFVDGHGGLDYVHVFGRGTFEQFLRRSRVNCEIDQATGRITISRK